MIADMAGGDNIDSFLLSIKKKVKDKEKDNEKKEDCEMDDFLDSLQVRGSKRKERKEREHRAGNDEGVGDRHGGRRDQP